MKADKMALRSRMEPAKCMAGVAAVFSLGILPLAFRNAFFDINRFKVELVLSVIPVLALASGCVSLFCRQSGKIQKAARDVRFVMYSLLVFLVFCIVSCAICGFSSETLLGTEGRYCGLLFLLCCGAVFVIVACGALDGKAAVDTAIAAAAMVALLGVLNAAGIDPLGFYEAMRLDQLTQFLSTIGNVDFFGAYLAMMYPLAGACFLYAPAAKQKIIYGFAACLIACGVVASRSDSAFFALQVDHLILLALAGNRYAQMSRALFLWGVSAAMLLLMRPLIAYGKWMIPYSGILKALCDTGLIWMICAALFALSLLCKKAESLSNPAPGSKKCLLVVFVCGMLMLMMLLGSMAYFTFAEPEIELGVLHGILRFDERWGTGRGMIYKGAAKAYFDFPIVQKLFGGGVDTAKRILLPYMVGSDSSVVFNDAHCQPLQFLLTTGLCGAAAFLGVYFLMLRACLRRIEGDPLLCGVFASLCGYAVIMLLGVTQPIMIMTYFSIAALAASRLNHLQRREKHES